MKFKSNEEIQASIANIAEEMQVEIVEVMPKVSKNPSLTIFIDHEDGVDLDLLEKFHMAIDLVLDEADVSNGQPYTLNVSSPGADRAFKTQADYEKNLNKDVEIKLYGAIKGKKFYEGILLDYSENWVEIENKEGKLKINLNQIVKINKAIKFD